MQRAVGSSLGRPAAIVALGAGASTSTAHCRAQVRIHFHSKKTYSIVWVCRPSPAFVVHPQDSVSPTQHAFAVEEVSAISK